MKTLKSIMVVDDSEADREFCKVIFQRVGGFHTVLEAESGDLAIEMFREYEASRAKYPDAFPPLVILLDINMPRMDGFEFLEAFTTMRDELASKDIEPSMIMMLSSSDAHEDKEKAQRFGLVKDYLVKPLSPNDAERIREAYGA